MKTTRSQKPVLITGGAGFIGSNLANALLRLGRPVVIFDNLSRAGVEQNMDWLKQEHGENVSLIQSDIRNAPQLRTAVEKASCIFHFAAQVAVTTSFQDPILDFEINAAGTLGLLELWRQSAEPAPLIFASTNKVYGDLSHLSFLGAETRYIPQDERLRRKGIGESTPLKFCSPYGCSKGVADQYVLDYAHSFQLPGVVFRMSCVYGPRQFGNEDQGWVAHFLIRARKGLPITIYGDGRQVRDILAVQDLVQAYLLAEKNIESIAGEAFNIGGGPDNTMSLRELLDDVANLDGVTPEVHYEESRLGDQKYYVSDISKFNKCTGWRPILAIDKGLHQLREWLNLSESNARKSEKLSLAEL